MRKLLLAFVVTIAATALWALPAMGANPSPPFNECPAIGSAPSCAVLIVVNPGGGLTILTDPNVGPFDGVEDTSVGVLNNSGAPLPSITLTGTSGAFGFDGDGLCSFITCTWTAPTGYEGPKTAFASISADANDGTLLFPTPLANGGTAYFSLEGEPSAITGGTIGHIEICKTLGSAGLVGVSPAANVTTPPTASFQYTVTDRTGTQTV